MEPTRQNNVVNEIKEVRELFNEISGSPFREETEN